jgi:hypothetical protein
MPVARALWRLHPQFVERVCQTGTQTLVPLELDPARPSSRRTYGSESESVGRVSQSRRLSSRFRVSTMVRSAEFEISRLL